MEILGIVRYRARPVPEQWEPFSEQKISEKFNLHVTNGQGPIVDGERLKVLQIASSLDEKAETYANMDVRVTVGDNNEVVSMEYYAP